MSEQTRESEDEGDDDDEEDLNAAGGRFPRAGE